MESVPEVIYVEFLTVPHLFRYILPVLIRSSGNRRVYVFDVTKAASFFCQVLGPVLRFKIEKLFFQMADVRDDQGACVVLQIRYHDLERLQAFILQEYPINENVAYLAKASVTAYDLYGYARYSELWHALVLIGTTKWHQKKYVPGAAAIHLYMYDRPFWKALTRYTSEADVMAHNMGTCGLGQGGLDKIWSFLKKAKLSVVLSVSHRLVKAFFKKRHAPISCKKDAGSARMMAEYFGQFNLDHPELISDLFFLDPLGIQGPDVCLVFNNMRDPVDQKKWKQMSDRGIAAVARTVQTSLVDEAKVPIFRHQYQSSAVDVSEPWRARTLEYYRTREYWSDFFRVYDIKLWTTFFKYEPIQMAIADALKDAGGISSVYQRSYESNPSPFFAAGSDLIFGFSDQGHDLHLKSGSDFKYHITVGYIGDNRFKYLRPLAQKIRNELLAQGAGRIITYFDESSVDDGRWFMGHDILRENYAFLLNKVLEDKKLAVIFKPKLPGTLARRLGPVAELLDAAQKTGRCYIFQEGIAFGSFPPAVAAMAGDISIQGCLWTATAGIEAALSGAKTLLVDREGWPHSPLYKLGNKVVFKDWKSTWAACADHWNTPGGDPKLGDWSAMINELDPFRDGLAAQRMSQYLKELLEGLRAGADPESLMEAVAQRYAKRWGKDKVQRGLRK